MKTSILSLGLKIITNHKIRLMNAQTRANKRYIERNKDEHLRKQREYYQRTKEKQQEQRRDRYILKREAAYKWFNKTATGFLPYEQGRKK